MSKTERLKDRANDVQKSIAGDEEDGWLRSFICNVLPLLVAVIAAVIVFLLPFSGLWTFILIVAIIALLFGWYNLYHHLSEKFDIDEFH